MEEQRTFQLEPVPRGAKFVTGSAAAALAVLSAAVFAATTFPINLTASMPVGFYRSVHRPVERGSIVGACVPEPYAHLAQTRGYLSFGICIPGLRPVMKYVAGVPGDTIEVRSEGVFINGIGISNTTPLRTDSLGRDLPNQLGRRVLHAGEYWLVANRDQGSFDSRYFGATTKILGVVEPLLTDGRVSDGDLRTELQNIGRNVQ